MGEEGPAETEQQQVENAPPLYVSPLPILVALLLIAFGAIAEAAGLKSPVMTFFGDPVFALFVGLLGAYLLAWRTLPNGRVGEAMNNGFDATGQILLTILLAWLIAAVLHLAIGSISVAAITASGILAPILDGLDVPAVIMALAIGSGALFALQVNSNFFWMFQSLLGVSTQGALKALTLVTALASEVSLVLILPLSLIV